jgi:hypothetical protein
VVARNIDQHGVLHGVPCPLLPGGHAVPTPDEAHRLGAMVTGVGGCAPLDRLTALGRWGFGLIGHNFQEYRGIGPGTQGPGRMEGLIGARCTRSGS